LVLWGPLLCIKHTDPNTLEVKETNQYVI